MNRSGPKPRPDNVLATLLAELTQARGRGESFPDAWPQPSRLAHRQAQPRSNIDAAIALAMADERAEHKPEPVELLGWL